jgi:hypothetical protein
MMNVYVFSPAANVALSRQSRVFFWNVADHRNRFTGLLLYFPFAGATGHEPGDSPMKKLLFAGAMLASCAAIQSASAADLALNAPPPPVVVVDEWTGGYIGLNRGGSWGRSATTYYDPDPAFVPFTTSQHMDGVLGGAQIGYNVKFNKNLVAGLEADFQGTGQRGSALFANNRDIRRGSRSRQSPRREP